MNKEDFKLRRLTENDWRDFRSLRIEAVTTEPHLFLASREMEMARDDEHWKSTLRSEGSAIFIMDRLGEDVGLTAAFRFRESPEDTVLLAMSFIRPDYRGIGLSELFYQARIDWAKAQPGINRIIVSHRAGNEASKAANQKFGFVLYGSEEIDFPDGTRDMDYRYELKF